MYRRGKGKSCGPSLKDRGIRFHSPCVRVERYHSPCLGGGGGGEITCPVCRGNGDILRPM